MITNFDHIVLTVKSIDRTVKFYTTVLGMEKETFGNGRVALKFGAQKINLHQFGQELEPKAAVTTPGSADICLITELPIEQALKQVESRGGAVLNGIVPRTGAAGPIQSIYLRDPDLNLIEVSSYYEPQ